MRRVDLSALQQRWSRLPPAVRSRGVPVLLAGLLALGLLLAFYWVVRDAVQQSELRHAAYATRAAAAWRCADGSPRSQTDCVAMRNGARGNAPLQSHARAELATFER